MVLISADDRLEPACPSFSIMLLSISVYFDVSFVTILSDIS